MPKKFYDLTNPQKSIWLTEQFYKGTSIGNITGSVIISQNVDFNALKAAINLFVKNNDSFRLKFTKDNENLVQYIEDNFENFSIDIIDVFSDKDVKKVERQMCDTPFNIFDSFLFSFKLFKFKDGHGGFVINAHHLIADAWTAGLVVNKIIEYYDSLIHSQIISNDPKSSYIDYIISEQKYLESEKFEKDKLFWNDIYKTIPEIATIPSISQNSLNELNYASKRKQFIIPKETMTLINNFCKENKASAFNFFMAVFSIYLSRVSSLDDFTIGTPILNRSNFKEKQATGMFISTVPFRISINHNMAFADYLSKISSDFSKIFRHQKYPYQYLLEDLRKIDSKIPNLYNVLISYQNVRSDKQTSNISYESRWVENNNISDDLDIHLYDMNDTGNINIAYDYLTNKYTFDDICSIHARILHIINQILSNNEISLFDIEIVTPDEKEKLLYEFNDTKANYPKDKTIAQLFEEQVEKTPDNIAVVFENKQLTYKELNEKANSLANYLLKLGISNGDVIGLRIDKSLEMIIGILGIIKCGAVYLPINLSYPQDRVSFMLSDSKSKLLLCSKENKDDFNLPINKLCIDLINTNIYSNKVSNINSCSKAGDTLYIIYTSGSTGTPKGAMITNRNVVRLMKNDKFLFDFNDNDVWTMFHSVAFDFSVWEMYGALLYGGKLILIPEYIAKDPILFLSLMRREGVTILNQTPTYFYNLLASELTFEDSNLKIRYIIYGGESLKPNLIYKWNKKYPNTKLINMYGITETTVHVTFKELDESDLNKPNSIIGKPIPTLKVLLLDKNLKLVPIGVTGEICVAGDGVFKGYLNRDALNKTKLVSNPYNPSEVLYRSGDSALIHNDGNLEYIKRIDTQVKIRGFRVELGEIEEKLLEFTNIDSCVVTTKSVENSHDLLCAYYVKNSPVNLSSIRSVLQKKLPSYMIPQYFIELSYLPYNYNGKIDKKALPLPIVSTNKEITLPRNEIDKKLNYIFKTLLNVSSISITDSFFELGGDSLTAITLCSKIYNELNIQLSVKDILENPIIKDLSDLISSKDTSTANLNIAKSKKKNLYVASYAQKRIFYSTQAISNGNTIAYNVSGGLLIDKILDVNKIDKAINRIVKEQSAFRTQFKLMNGEVYQEIIDNVEIKINCYEARLKDKTSLINNFPKPFDLSTAPLLRVAIYFLDNKKTLILLDTHHIIVDGASLNILIDNFCKLYNGDNVENLDFEYIDYSEWENSFIESTEIKKYDEYWTNAFASTEISSLSLPYDFPANSKSFKGNKISYTMEKETFKKLEQLSKKYNVSTYTIFLSALYILLYKYTGQNDLIIGTPLEGRNFEETNNIIGMFVNNIVLKNSIIPSDNVSNLFTKTQNIVTDAISNQPYPYELILKKLKLDKQTSLLDVVLTYQNTKKSIYSMDNCNLELIYADTKTSKFNIWLEIIPDLAKFNLEYNTSLFKEETISSFLEHYIFILEQIINKTDITIDDIEIITPKEQKLLQEFNSTDGPINDDTVVSIFEEQVRLNPDNIAIICNDEALTYDELNKRANSLAHILIKNGIGANDIVCIMTNRSFETIIAMIAILKAGAAFFNVDPNYPIERTKYYIEDSKTKYVLTQSELKDKVCSIENCIEIDLNIEDIYNKNFENPNVNIKPSDLSYLIYTSGSTGKPKGTMLNQVGFANMVKAMTLVLDYLKEGNKHCIASVTSTPFDIFVYEIIVSLTHGLKIAMANNAEHRNPKLLDKLIRKYSVDVMTVTPSLMKINYDNREPNTALAMVKNMVFGGEPLPEKFVEDLRGLADDITIYNIYGPSEITILSNVQNLNGEKEITVGPPIMNTQIHVLDKNMKQLPIGVVGEIYISGIQVGYGYIGKPELTSEKFLDNPFGPGKMYKSGDIGRWTFDGKVQCLGRIDHQIKLRGLRIELGEIENIMLNAPGVSSAVVNKIEIDGKEALCGYYTSDNNLSEDSIKDILRKTLPAYMVPTYIVKLQQMPYTINRKIDRKALPLPGLNKPATNNKINIDELNSIEEKLLQIWKNILKIDDIDINDNFFDIGGDSVAAISMQIEAVKYGLDFEYGDIFTFPTIKQLSANLKTPDEVFIKNYDYTRVNSILGRNNINNLDLIKKIDIKNILLIGSTGYLGAHILDAFFKEHSGIVYCLVREKDGLDIKERLKGILNFYFGNKYDNFFDTKIKVIFGDIVKENLSLSENDYNELKNNIDVVINSGALVKHFGIKKKFEEINVNGTKHVIDFCLSINKRLIHVSTISVSGNGEKEESIIETPENINNKKLFRETDIYVGQNIKGVYSTTKFRAELLVLEAIADKGLDAQILRLGNITNRYSDGMFQMNIDENAFAKRIKSLIEIGAFPKYLLDHSIELTPVDLAAEAIIKSANYISTCNVLHIYNTNLLSIKLFTETLNELGIELLPVSEKMMTDIITGILADNTRKEILSGIVYDLDENKQLIYTSNVRLDCEFTYTFLKKIGFTWKELDKQYIIRYMNYFDKIKFIKE